MPFSEWKCLGYLNIGVAMHSTSNNANENASYQKKKLNV